jgi:uncharacterized protein (TIGR04168 family)
MPVDPDSRARLALIGDTHSGWDFDDVGYFNRSTYELLLLTGDLGGSQARDGLRVARTLSALRPKALVMPGNNDVEEYPRIAAELTYRRARAHLLDDVSPDDVLHAEPPLLCGYSLHPQNLASFEFTIIAARPFSMGGPEVAFPDALERTCGLRTMEQSIERLRDLVDRAPSEHLVFFGHNGPTGLGDRADDPWGRDFHVEQGDWGDPDLREAIRYAGERKRKVLAVLAGHMHWSLREPFQARLRRWQRQEDGCLYVNAARVPRVFPSDGGSLRHHIEVRLGPRGASARQLLVSEAGKESGE